MGGIPRNSGFQRAAAVAVFLLLPLWSGCGAMVSHNPVPREIAARAQIPGFPNVRRWSNQETPEFVADMVKSRDQMMAYFKAHPEEPPPTHTDILAISGGGENGAFGAGLLCGWTQKGDRPKFRLVTGISIGALIAPFAFVGSSCDEKLRDACTTISSRDLFTLKPLLSIVGSDSLTDNTPMREMLNRWVDLDLLAAVAREHAAGRRLLIGTTDLDAQRLVIWDMGAIASSGNPGALELFRKIMLASASIPGVFPPVYFDVEAGGKRFDEMHVDGGVISQVFLWGANIDLLGTGREMGIGAPLAPVRLFVLRNALLKPEWKPINPNLTAIFPRTFDTLIKAQGIGDLFRLYAMAQREGIDFNIACIPNDFNVPLKEPFDRQYMNALFDLGFKLGKEGYPWVKEPLELGVAPAGTE